MTYELKIKQMFQRLEEGSATEEDISWAKRHIEALHEWPDDLDDTQRERLANLERWTA